MSKLLRSGDLELKDKVVAINRVVKVTKGGRHFSFSAIVVVGNENGIVGHGLGKANEVTEAITKAIDNAKKNLIKVPIINGTIPHSQFEKFGGARVLLNTTSKLTPLCLAISLALLILCNALIVALTRLCGLDDP